jgi:uncharacterized phage protein gp47/JayE
MPWSRPTLTNLRTQAAGDITTTLAGADGLLRRSNLNVVANILAGLANLHYGYEDWIALQAVPFTSTQEYLEGWAALKGIIRQPAEAFTGTATGTGVNGTDCPLGTTLLRSDGTTYVTTADATVSGGVITVSIQAQTPGSAGQMSVGTAMTLGTAIAGINANFSVASVIASGTDVESDDAFRTRMLQRYANPPQGGAVQDYVGWALAVPGVTRAWCLPNGKGIGTVIVYTMFDVTEAAYGGFPQGTNGVATNETRDSAATGDQLAVANYIFPLRPVTALVYSYAPQASAQNFTINGLLPNTTAMQNSVKSAITGAFLSLATPGGVLLSNGTTGGKVYLANIEAAINAIPGIIDFIITSPTSDISVSNGYLATLGTVTFT